MDDYKKRSYGAHEIGMKGRVGIVVVDFQVAFTDKQYPLGGAPLIMRGVDNTERLLKVARAAGVPIASCYTGYTSRRDMPYWKVDAVCQEFFHDHPGSAIEPRLLDKDYDLVTPKPGHPIFFQTPVVPYFIKEGVQSSGASAQSGELVIANWGGDWNDRCVRFIEAPLVESKGIKIVRALNLEPERKAKLLAEKNLPRGTLSLAQFTAGDAYELHEQGIVETLDYSKIPNAANIRPSLRSPYFVPFIVGGCTLAYNPKYIKTPPTSFADLWNPEYAGKLGVLDQSFFNWIYMAALVGGGKMNNVDAAWGKLAEMKQKMKPRIYRSSFPKEGAITVVFGALIPKKAPNKDAAYHYLNSFLDPKAVGLFCEASMYAPSITNVVMTDALKAKIDFTPDQSARLQNVDYAYQAKNIAGWLERWNKEFKG